MMPFLEEDGDNEGIDITQREINIKENERIEKLKDIVASRGDNETSETILVKDVLAKLECFKQQEYYKFKEGKTWNDVLDKTDL